MDDEKNIKKREKSDRAIAAVILFSFFIAITIGLLSQQKEKEEQEKKDSYPQYNSNTSYQDNKKEVIYYELQCFKTTIKDNYELSTKIISNYRDGEVQKVEIDFKYYKRNDRADDQYVFNEIEEFNNLNLAGLTKKTEDNGAIFTIDFENHPELKENGILKDYSYFPTSEQNILTQNNGYSCIGDSTTKYE